MKKFDKVTIRAAPGLERESRQFAGLDAIVMKIEGNLITLAIDHDNRPETEPIIITVRSEYIQTISVLWGLWLAIRRIFKRN